MQRISDGSAEDVMVVFNIMKNTPDIKMSGVILVCPAGARSKG